jgi:hypothetical protein
VHSLMRHPQSHVAMLIFYKKKVSRRDKSLIAMLKAWSITDWLSSINRTDSPLQFAVIDALIEMTNQKTMNTITTWLNFDELRHLIAVVPDRLAVRVLHLIAVINFFNFVLPN